MRVRSIWEELEGGVGKCSLGGGYGSTFPRIEIQGKDSGRE
jgi:hypothetical protein